ncbi:hypothetical protein, partial [Rhizohabitans arisaemae]|uniref:hypothetical protein n=1 Tax=Rhizohabitans arisaemae TaxID=2720610 RepID=UPI0024B13469
MLSLQHTAEAARNPNADETHYTQNINELSADIDKEWDKARTSTGHEVNALIRIVDLVRGKPKYRDTALALKQVVGDLPAGDGRIFASWRDSLAGLGYGQSEAGALLRALNEKAAGAVRALGAQRGADHPAVKAWNAGIGAKSGVTAVATTDELVNSSPLKGVVDFSALMRYQPGDVRYRQEISGQIQQLLQRNNEVIGISVIAINDLQSRYGGAYLWTTVAPPAPPNAYEIAMAEAQARQKDIDGFADGLRLITGLLGLVNPAEAAKAVVVCDSVIKFATTVNAYVPKLVGKGLKEAIFQSATVDVAKGLYELVTALLPLFLANEPSPAAMILSQVSGVREQVAKLHNTMNEQFNRVNKNLNLIFKDMLAKFDEVLKLQMTTIVQLTEIQFQLHAIEQRIDAWSTEIIKALQNDALKDARAKLTEFIGYRITRGEPIPSVDTFDGAINEVHSAAVNIVNKTPFVVSPGNYQTHKNDPLAAIKPHLGTGGAAGFLSWYGKEKYQWPDQVAVVPNAAAWLSMANGYRRLSVENPDFAAQMDPVRTNLVAEGGEDVNAAVQKFSQALDKPGADGTYTNALYRGLVADYKTAAG